MEPCWECVQITDEEDASNPRWKCNGCGEFKSGGATRVANHLLGEGGSKKCSLVLADDAFRAQVEKVMESAASKAARKHAKKQVALVNQAAGAGTSSSTAMIPRAANQPALSFGTNHAEACDKVIGELFYACNLPAALADHPKWKRAVEVLRTAPASYKPPNRQKMYTTLLDTTVSSLRTRLAPLEEAVLRNCCTMLSDGWDTVDHDHLINFLHGIANCMFFDGTVELQSDDSENAVFVGELLRQRIINTGKFAVIHVCTDTCSVMQERSPQPLNLSSHLPPSHQSTSASTPTTLSTLQAAWALLGKYFPWLTCSGCGTHVLSLELKDMAKIPEVAAIITKMGIILSLFWGRKRWPRRKLRETIQANHGKSFGLYRAKVTRFAGAQRSSMPGPAQPCPCQPISSLAIAQPCPPSQQTRLAGKFREMSRGLRCKADLQQVDVSSEYNAQKFSKGGRKEDELEAGEELDANIGAKVKAIVLDDDGFWQPLTMILYVAMPLIKLLRAMDGKKPMMGKVYDRMFAIGERIKTLESKGISWAVTMAEKHAYRWEYLHSPFHAAGYALDPEFLETVGELDSATQEGLMTVLERMALRDVIMGAADPEAAMTTITTNHPDVVSRVAQAEREFAIYQSRQGVFSRGSVLANAKSMEPAVWWSTYGRHLPLLSAYAPRILDQPVAASYAERNWSVYGQIRSAQRSRMKHAVADKLVYAFEALQLEEKMKDAGWQPDVERWESDTRTAKALRMRRTSQRERA